MENTTQLSIARGTRISLALSAVLGLFTSSAQAETVPLRVPLTPTEARNLGLDPGSDGALYRVLQFADGPVAEGSAEAISISPREQRGVSSEVFLQDTADGRWCEIGSAAAFADIALNLPSAALLTGMRIWGFDQSTNNNLTVSLIERCTPNNQAGNVITSVITELSSSASPGNFTNVALIVANNSIDNDTCSYTLRTRYSTPDEAVLCAGANLRLQKVRINYDPQ